MWLVLPAALFVVFQLAACEDDPILGPTEGENGGGSYGNLRFEGTAGEDSASRTPAAPYTDATPNNPKVF